jgi:dTDP-glucose 4,6-dehydratase
MSKKIVYVTGCLGFIGYHVAKQMLDDGHYVIGVDKGTYAANWNVLPDLRTYGKRFDFICSDINDLERLVDCDYVINTAAETHVDNSIADSDNFVHSNIDGVHHLLKLIASKGQYKMPTLLHFSTDEVYGDIDTGSFTEEQLLKPSNPYAATKAAADMLITAWARTHNVPYVIVRPTNNYGTNQYVEKLIPKTVKYLQLSRKVPLHAGGTPRRTWLHVSDTAKAISTIVNAEVINEIYNIPGNFETSNLDVVKSILEQMFIFDEDNLSEFIDFGYERPGQDVRYSIDGSKLAALGWKATASFYKELPDIVDYYKDNWIW